MNKPFKFLYYGINSISNDPLLVTPVGKLFTKNKCLTISDFCVPLIMWRKKKEKACNVTD